jgi:putative transcriptional regulator
LKKSTFDELLTSLKQGGKILRGKKAPGRTFHPDDPDVSAIRRHLGLTQQKFAELLGITPGNTPQLGTWKKESGGRRPRALVRRRETS